MEGKCVTMELMSVHPRGIGNLDEEMIQGTGWFGWDEIDDALGYIDHLDQQIGCDIDCL